MSVKAKTFYWKGKKVSEKVYKDRQRRTELAEQIRGMRGRFCSDNLEACTKIVDTEDKAEKQQDSGLKNSSPTRTIGDEVMSEKLQENSTSLDTGVMEGRRIVHMKFLGQQMFCYACKSILSLTDVMDEVRSGLASIILIKCRCCGRATRVQTDKEHKALSGRYHFDCNTKVALGTINGGIGNRHLNKVLTALDIPKMHWNTYRTHEKEVSRGLEQSAEESCIAAAYEERMLTIEHAEKLLDLL
ncbi:hypothetical protein QAD02_002167 [Eretmocerus hayati]|uniref:Uncharacterized protein n=1 Tax=Eretmocerus hayati TaxID=131215 RepID=A0ACC2NJB9_9HYME|nr:hypothetical protein QAD02_002167 [Eretmocerus hayati]